MRGRASLGIPSFSYLENFFFTDTNLLHLKDLYAINQEYAISQNIPDDLKEEVELAFNYVERSYLDIPNPIYNTSIPTQENHNEIIRLTELINNKISELPLVNVDINNKQEKMTGKRYDNIKRSLHSGVTLTLEDGRLMAHDRYYDREQFLKAVHYTNLQPMWAKDNILKSNKII